MNILTKKALMGGACLFVMALPFVDLQAQTNLRAAPRIHLNKEVHNFGIIAEQGGEVYYRFFFTNEGDAPLIVTRVTTDCGCTTTSFTRNAVEPGEEGYLTVAYDPIGRPGAFVKNIQVYTNAEEKPIKLQITGSVTTTGGVEGNQHVETLGSLQISSNFLAFPAVSSQRPQMIRFSIFNRSHEKVKVSLHADDRLVSLSQKAFILEENQPAEVVITSAFDAKEIPPSVYLTTLELTLEEGTLEPLHKKVALKLPVVPDFFPPKAITYPRAELTTYYDLGKLTGETPLEGYFEVNNLGEGILELLDIYCPNKAIAFHALPREAAKGEVIRIDYRIDTALLFRLKTGFDENIDLIFNDPSAPYRRVKIILSL